MRLDESLASVLADSDSQSAAAEHAWLHLVAWLVEGRNAAVHRLGDEERRLVAALREKLSPDIRAVTRPALLGCPPSELAQVMLGPEAAPERAPVNPPVTREEAEAFRFETGDDGVIFWASHPARAGLIGETIAFTAPGSRHGVDGQVSGAFRRRAPFRDARLSIGGEGPCSGEWRISAGPIFSPGDGRFRGYRGTARRPEIGEVAGPRADEKARGQRGAADTLRQLVHELRTPLTAIIGFSEVIEGQFLGPAPASYRRRAGTIRQQGQRLLTALEDLDFTARIETGPPGEGADLGALVSRMVEGYRPDAEVRGYRLKLDVAPGLSPVRIDSDAIERMCQRLLDATLATVQRGETIAIVVAGVDDGREAQIAVTRPVMLAGRDAVTLLDPGYSPDSETGTPGAALGLGFALRLVRNIASVAGGRLEVTRDQLLLCLPLKAPSDLRGHG